MRFKEFYLNEKLGKTYDYSCLLYDFPPDIATYIKNWTLFNIPDDILAEDGREDEIHTTLLYGVHDADPSKSFSLLKNYNPFYIQLGKVSKFDTPEYDVLKIEVHSPELHVMRSLVEKNIENTQTHPVYVPHTTLAYVKKGSADQFLDSISFEGMKVLVNAIDFSSKNGKRDRMYFQDG